MKTGRGPKFGRRWGAVLAGGMLACAAPGASAQEWDDAGYVKAVVAAFNATQPSLSRSKCPDMLKRLRPIIDDQRFVALTPDYRRMLLTVAVRCVPADADPRDGLRDARALTTLPNASINEWNIRFRFEVDHGANADAVQTLETVTAADPASTADLPLPSIFQLWRQLRTAKPDAGEQGTDKEGAGLLRFFQLVSQPAFAPGAKPLDLDFVRLDYAQRLAKSGQQAAARAQLDRIARGNARRDAMLDPALRPLMPADFSLSAAYEAELAIRRSALRQNPNVLLDVISIANLERRLARPEAALKTLEAGRPEGAKAASYTDLRDNRQWWWDNLAQTYQQLGRYEDGAAAYRKAIAANPLAISMPINFAHYELDFGHGQAALAILDAVDAHKPGMASPYGLMEYHLAHGCGAHMVGKTQIAEADLAYAKAHGADGPEVLRNLYACMGRDDEAAALLIAALRNPDESVATRANLSDYAPLPPNATARLGPYREGLMRLRARNDVRAAIDETGGIGQFDTQPN